MKHTVREASLVAVVLCVQHELLAQFVLIRLVTLVGRLDGENLNWQSQHRATSGTPN